MLGWFQKLFDSIENGFNSVIDGVDYLFNPNSDKFDISFGEETANSIGSIKCKDGSVKSINVVTYDFDFSDEWVEERKNEIYSMAEDINIILQNIMENDSFVK